MVAATVKNLEKAPENEQGSKTDKTMIVIVGEEKAKVGDTETEKVKENDGMKYFSVKSISGPYQLSKLVADYEKYHGASYYNKKIKHSIFIMFFIVMLAVFGLGLFFHMVTVHNTIEETIEQDSQALVNIPEYNKPQDQDDDFSFNMPDELIGQIQALGSGEEFTLDGVMDSVASLFSPFFGSSAEILPVFPDPEGKIVPWDGKLNPFGVRFLSHDGEADDTESD